MTNRIIVAIDGYSSCGKSTIAKQLASDVGYLYIDTGAMYRAVGYYCIEEGIINNLEIDSERLKKDINNVDIYFKSINVSQHIFLNGVDIEDKIRTLYVGNIASKVSALAFVRRHLVQLQQQMGLKKGIVMDGRDIGTVVFPNAELKIFVTADTDVRAKRRYRELLDKGEEVDYDEVLENIIERDNRDTTRTESPLYRAKDAKLLDNSSFDLSLQQEVVMNWFNEAVKLSTIKQ